VRINRRTLLYSSVGTVAGALASASGARLPLVAKGAYGRPFRWHDAYGRTAVEQATFAAGGNAIALQAMRPLSAGGKFPARPWPGLLDPRADLWLLDGNLGDPRRLSVLPGGAWSPWFSPNGRRLAALTLTGPGKVGLVVWELSRGTYRVFQDANVEVFLSRFRTDRSAYGMPMGVFQIPRQYVWLDDDSILFVDHAGSQQEIAAITRLSGTLRRLHQREEAGALSVRVWSGGSPTCGVGSRLARLACDTGEVEVLYEGDIRGVSLSPDRRRLAVMAATGNISPRPGKAMQWPLRGLTGLDDALVELKLTLLKVAQPGNARDIEGVFAIGDVAPSRLPQWSADSSRVAIPVRTTYSDAPSTGSDVAWEVNANTGVARAWAASSALDAELLATLLVTDGLDSKRTIEQRPQSAGHDAYGEAGQINGGAWRFGRQQVMFWSGLALTLISPQRTTTLQQEFAVVQPPVLGDRGARTVAIRRDGKTIVLAASAEGCQEQDLSVSTGWSLLAVSPVDASVVYKEDAEAGTFLILARPGTRARRSLLSFNRYFSDVRSPQRRILSHSFPDGSTRKGLLLLPIGHRSGERHPVVISAYPAFSPLLNDPVGRPNGMGSVIYPIQYLLTKGFAFFQAPFPIDRMESMQPMKAAVDAVVPWLDVLGKDPNIVPEGYGFFGYSLAGYVALALEAWSHRFKAIVAWDTFPEIGFDTLHAYAGDVALNCAANLVQGSRMFWEARGQPYRPGPVPPWKDPAQYIRNDPLFNLSEASTPLLLVEGEYDTDPREMEEVYSTLYGRGVPVELAYYWGEGHIFKSPGDIRDSWMRTEAFFKRYLHVQQAAATPEALHG
jgi:dipeptidyl aminopeptidase/acylaminoacyl peptidase